MTECDGPDLQDAKTIVERLRPRDRAMLRPWLLARYSVSGDLPATSRTASAARM